MCVVPDTRFVVDVDIDDGVPKVIEPLPVIVEKSIPLPDVICVTVPR